MTYAYVHDIASSWGSYRDVVAAMVDPSPVGRIVHLAGPTGDGVRVIDVWVDQDTGDRFRVEQLVPAFAALGASAATHCVFRELHAEHLVVASPSPETSPTQEER